MSENTKKVVRNLELESLEIPKQKFGIYYLENVSPNFRGNFVDHVKFKISKKLKLLKFREKKENFAKFEK